VEQQRPRGLRSFVQSPIGRSVLLALGIGVVFGAFYVSILLAIPAMLVVALWLPIYAGLKRPRYLAIGGLVIILLVAPIVTAAYTSELLVPIGAADSAHTGIDWSVTVGNTTVDSQSNQIAFALPSGVHSYDVATVPGYSGGGAGSVTVGSSAVKVPVTFSPVTYPVTFTESGLLTGAAWSVTIGATTVNSTSTTLGFHLANGSYAFRVSTPTKYTPLSASGTAHVNASATAIALTFSKSAYPTTFTQTGVAPGVRWGVTVDGTTVTTEGTTVVLDLPNGTDAFSAAASKEYTTTSGQSVVVAGAPARGTVAFSAVTYPVTFTESQLPVDATWTVTIGSVEHQTTSTSLVFDLSNGTYVYVVGAPHGESPVEKENSVGVAGGATGVTVVFNATAYPVEFLESGLAGGTPWSVSSGPTTVPSTEPSIDLNLSAGSHPYTVSPVPGYTVTESGSVSVGVDTPVVNVAYSPVVYPVTFTESNLALDTAWNVTLNGISHLETTTSIVIDLTNGSYPYTIPAAGGKAPPAVNASVVVDGAAVSIAVPFAGTTYSVVFTESGLAAGSVLENAALSPFHGSASTVFSWTATLNPQFLPSGTSTPLWVNLYISTCPGATGNNSSACNAGYPLVVLTDFFCTDPATAATCEASAEPLTTATPVTFNYTVGEDGIWEWQMGVAVEDLALHVPSYALLVGDPQYNGLEGPVIGSFGAVFEDVLPSIYLESFLYLGLPFYAVLLLYAIFKNRERRREDARVRAAGPIPPTSGAETGGPPAAAPAPGAGNGAKPPPGPVPGESACPNCGAVVYAGESKCWKCGAALGGTAPPPLPSSPK